MSKTFELLTPVNGPDGQITELTLEEPTVSEIAKLHEANGKQGGVRAMIMLIAGQTQQPVAVINQLRARDFQAMQDYIGSFFGDTPPAE